jgi:membrane fusion protein (multidrug efflux system)
LARTDAARYSNLAASGAGTEQQGQQARITLRQTEASLAGARADARAAEVQREALRAQLDSSLARVRTQQAQLAQAQLNLSYTRLLAPIDGTVDQRSVQVGNFVSPGAPIMVVVPLDKIYVVASYRELALRHMRPGQAVRIHIDTYQIDLNGFLDSLPASSGAAYAAIPPNNSTGNFTKIVQRFPVKIVFAPHQPLVQLVRVGMSAETTVDTHLDDIVSAQRGSHNRVSAREAIAAPTPGGN